MVPLQAATEARVRWKTGSHIQERKAPLWLPMKRKMGPWTMGSIADNAWGDGSHEDWRMARQADCPLLLAGHSHRHSAERPLLQCVARCRQVTAAPLYAVSIVLVVFLSAQGLSRQLRCITNLQCRCISTPLERVACCLKVSTQPSHSMWRKEDVVSTVAPLVPVYRQWHAAVSGLY